MEADDALLRSRLKLAVVLEKKISVGGGFNQSINAALQILRIAPEQYAVEVFTTIESNIDILAKHGLKAKHLAKPKRRLSKKLAGIFQSARRRHEEITEFELELQRQGIDLVYFTAPSGYALDLQTTPYIFTIWDLCHLEHPEFPEVTGHREFEKREELYSRAVPKAVVTLTDGDDTSQLASHRYGTARERFIEMPFSPAPLLEASMTFSDAHREVLLRYGLPADYLFYPAQFWTHKNHRRILEACALLATRKGSAPHVVFAGGDQGHGAAIKSLADRLGLSGTSHFLGFIPAEDMTALYRGAKALVMPSYFGPSNLPPMEAWMMGKPVLYPERFAAFAGDAALLFDPDDAHSLADCIERLNNEGSEINWQERGRQRLEDLARERAAAEDKLTLLLSRLSSRRSAGLTHS